MFLNQTPPGGGSQLHVHPYEETFVIEEGTVTFEVDGQVINAAAGQIVVVPPDAPHKFMNTGERTLRKVSIHPVPKAITYWLEK